MVAGFRLFAGDVTVISVVVKLHNRSAIILGSHD